MMISYQYKSYLFSEEKPSFEYSVFVEKRTAGRRLVIPDVHACPNTLQNLVEKVGLTHDDQLFLLGDYINKGKDSLGVLDFLLSLLRDNYHIFPLRGNHEQMLLEEHQKIMQGKRIDNWLPSILRGKGVTDRQGIIKDKYVKFFCNLPFFYELDTCFLVHAGFNCNVGNPLANYHDMLWIRRFQTDAQKLKNKTVVHGHTPHRLNIIKEHIQNRHSVIPLDNGCVMRNAQEMGNLLCLDLDSFELHIQPNID